MASEGILFVQVETKWTLLLCYSYLSVSGK